MLSEAQEKAVRASGHCLITACPGSGKTTVLVHRAEHILSTPKMVVLGVTFTSESAQELERRIRAKVPNAGKRVTCGTFHGLCKRQLEASGQKFRVINDQQQTDLLRRAYEDTVGRASGIEFDACVAYIDAVKCAVDPIMPSPEIEPRVEVYERYEELLRRTGAYDFADLLRLCVRGMRMPPGMDGSVATIAATHMLVDEFQDTDPVQYEWMLEHLKQGVQVTVVGDDDQSIYCWRNAGGMRSMEDFRIQARATHVPLDTTYRYPKEIMEVASALILNNIERIPKVLRTVNRNQGSVQVLRFESREAQADAIWASILETGTPHDWVVLARTNALLEGLEMTAPESIRVERVGGRSFWDMQAPSLFLALVRGVAMNEMHSLDTILRATGLGDESLVILHRAYKSHLPGSVQRFVADKKRASIASPDERLRAQMKVWKQMLQGDGAHLVLIGMAYYLKQNVQRGDKSTDVSVARNNARFDACAAILARFHGPLFMRLKAVLEKQDSKDNAVRLMTMHASKGLEFKHVWIMGCEDGVIPSQKGLLEEERRLFYVAMTRAKLNLTVSYVLGKWSAPSPFLFEAGMHALPARQVARLVAG